MKNFITTISILLPILFFTGHINASTPAEELADILKTYETVQGNFNQTLVDSKGQPVQESSGVFTVKSPGYFNWETKDPFPQLLIADLKTIWLYDPDLEQVTETPYSGSVDQSPALLLSGNVEQIKVNYNVTKSDVVKDAFILTPTSGESNFTELELLFANAILVSMQLKDSLEQTTTFTFRELTINRPVDDSLFIFEAPEGVDILKNE
ncbi:MAG: outer membrane lipoprotein carrier protein [Cellvibrionaceae bacterium]|jgi:outer membrane lipoprotein carrier protein